MYVKDNWLEQLENIRSYQFYLSVLLEFIICHFMSLKISCKFTLGLEIFREEKEEFSFANLFKKTQFLRKFVSAKFSSFRVQNRGSTKNDHVIDGTVCFMYFTHSSANKNWYIDSFK